MERGCKIFVGDLHNAYVVVKYELWSSKLWKKLAMVKDLVIVANSQLGGGGYTQTGEVWKSDVKFLSETFTMPLFWRNMNLGQVFC